MSESKSPAPRWLRGYDRLVPAGWTPIGWLEHLRRLQECADEELALLYREWADAVEAEIGVEGMRREDQLYGKRFR